MNPAWAFSYSSHYAQAYQQQPSTTSTVASASYAPSVPSSLPPSNASSSWTQPGHVRCTYKACSFTGSAKTVETHMMDRHLIYPPGWQKHSEWDADPSLKGKPIPIQGTNLILDSPEDLTAWINERKKRWPSSARVEDKKRKMEEAVARGQLSPHDLGIFANNKRPRMSVPDEAGNNRSGRGRGRGRGGRGRGQVDGGWRGRGRGRGGATQALIQPPDANMASPSSDEESSDGGEPEVMTSKSLDKSSLPREPETTPLKPLPPRARRQPPQAKPPQTSSNSNLLRNLLLPEIRMTVSNLSQAIHFLVENDFLVDVEMTPGEAENTMIQVVQDDGVNNKY